jgi:hypothetical protein
VLKCDGNVALAADYLRASEATLATPFIKIRGPNMTKYISSVIRR